LQIALISVTDCKSVTSAEYNIVIFIYPLEIQAKAAALLRKYLTKRGEAIY